jgi:hypothetical protein
MFWPSSAIARSSRAMKQDQQSGRCRVPSERIGLVFVFRTFRTYFLRPDRAVRRHRRGQRLRPHALVDGCGQVARADWLRLTLIPGVGGETQRKLLSTAFGLPETAVFAAGRRGPERSIVGDKRRQAPARHRQSRCRRGSTCLVRKHQPSIWCVCRTPTYPANSSADSRPADS